MNGRARLSRRQVSAVTGAKTTTAVTSATRVALWGSRERASSRFQNACRNAAARANESARGGIVGQE